jgi:hypothetical protein
MMIDVALIMLGVISYQEKKRKQRAQSATSVTTMPHSHQQIKAAG